MPKELPPSKEDRGTITVVSPLNFGVHFDTEQPDVLTGLGNWRGKAMPKEGDRVYRVAGYDTEADKPRDKWRSLPPELDLP